MRTTNYLKLSALVLGSAIAGCSGNNTASTGPTNSGGDNTLGTGGTANGGAGTKAGSTTGGANVGGNATGGAATGGANVGGNATGGAATGGANVGGNATGGKATGGANVGGNATGGNATGGAATGGANVGGNATGGVATGGANVGGNATGGKATGGANVGGNATGGTPTATGGTATGTGGGTGCSHAANVISDFESGKGDVYPITVASGGAPNGFWYVYKDAPTSSTDTASHQCTNSAQVPAAAKDAAVAAEKPAGGTHDPTNTCNQWAMHSSISSCPTYSGFGAALSPTIGSQVNKPIDVSNYDGITFWIKAGSGAQGPLYLEMQSQECAAPPPNGGGTAKSQAIDMYNCHGKLFSTIPTAWTQVWVPFGTTGPRWFPTVSTSSSGKTCAATDFCEVPQLVTKDMLSLQFSLEDPFNSQATAYANYDVWIDDVAGYKFADTSHAGVAAPSTWTSGSPTNPFPQNKAVTAPCGKPTGADGWLIGDAYVNWKKNFVRTEGSYQKVISPEIDGGATVSEGIAYGMMISVYMGDKALFDGLYNYWKAHVVSGTTLMNWKFPSGGGTSPSGAGSATDADEDAAFAVLEASKQWPSGGYSATALISDVYTKDIDSGTSLPKGGSNYGSINPTNPSYFSPAMYREFAKVDSHPWAAVITAVYGAFSTGIGNAVTSGLVPAWCGGGNCSTVSSNGAATDNEYQYDSHRVPWRLALDTCWNGTTTGNTYLGKLIGFFNTQSDTEGLSNLEDIYTTTGSKDTANGANNSMSLIGCAGVGAMATGTTGLRDRAWQFLLEGQYTANPTFVNGVAGGTKPGYTYYNATVGLLTMMTMSGNFYVM